jgi:hypothetical protein
MEDGRIPDAILAAAYNQDFDDFHLFFNQLTLTRSMIDNGWMGAGEKTNDYEIFGFKEIANINGTPYAFPSRYFQFEPKTNHPLTEFFKE